MKFVKVNFFYALIKFENKYFVNFFWEVDFFGVDDDFFEGGVKIDFIFFPFELIGEKNIFFEIFWGLIFFVGGVPYPIFFFTNLLFRVKLGYTPNFASLGHLEVP